jgi:hypothetical protein
MSGNDLNRSITAWSTNDASECDLHVAVPRAARCDGRRRERNALSVVRQQKKQHDRENGDHETMFKTIVLPRVSLHADKADYESGTARLPKIIVVSQPFGVDLYQCRPAA